METFLQFLRKIIPKWLFYFFQPAYHLVLAFCGALIYRFPSRKLIVVGVTGTKGKSSVVYLASKMLNDAGIKTGAIGSIEWRIGEQTISNPTAMTMPGRFAIQRMIRKMADAGCQVVVLEVTSEGIRQQRHRFIDFDAAVFTNLQPEHIESHGSFEKYRAAKLELFKALTASRENKNFQNSIFKKTIIANSDDENAEIFLNFSVARMTGFAIKADRPKTADLEFKKLNLIIPNSYSISDKGVKFLLEGKEFFSALLGEFNLYNILATIAVVRLFGISDEQIQSSLKAIKYIPGRMEFVEAGPPATARHEWAGQQFKVVVDYAHTPDSMKAVLSLISKSKIQNSKLLCVFGSAGGGRDKWKRPEMGKIAAGFCDKIILTTDDPYDEDPHKIIMEIKKGIPGDKLQNVEVIVDRKEAIVKVLHLASPGDIVVILGRGSEEYMRGANGKLIPWNDKRVVLEILSK